MRIKKMYQGEAPENKIVGTYTESNTDTYNCNYVNNSSIVESGTNYVKYGDGTMICWGEKSGTTTFSDYWSLCKRSPDGGSNVLYVDFPQTFISVPIVNIQSSGSSGTFSNGILNRYKDKFYFLVFKASSTSDTYYWISYIAIGKWK